MLSAIAARKAAQATRQEPVVVESSSTPDPQPSPSPITVTQRSSKRKPTRKTSNEPRQKKVKCVKQPKERYFEEKDTFRNQDDLIVIESDDDDEDDILSEDFDLTDEPVAPTPVPPVKKKRRWSPSIPLDDSSEEERSGGPRPSFEGSSLPSYRQPPKPQPLSTFQPCPDQNIICLTGDETTALLGGHWNGSAVVLSLAEGDTLCLVGTYSFTVLQGSVTFAGVTLCASKRTHRVFAPRSSPVPIMEGSSAGGSIQGLTTISDSVKQILNDQTAVVVIHELASGVEGLGKICRTFDGAFHPSRTAENDSHPDFHLLGVHLVKPYCLIAPIAH